MAGIDFLFDSGVDISPKHRADGTQSGGIDWITGRIRREGNDLILVNESGSIPPVMDKYILIKTALIVGKFELGVPAGSSG